MAWSRVSLAAVFAAVLTTGVGAATKTPPVALNVGPAISFEPGNVRITSRVEPAGANRLLVIEVQSDGHYSSSEVPLDGDQGPRTRTIFLKNLPAGDYEVIATLRTETGAEKVARGKFQVVSGRPDSQ